VIRTACGFKSRALATSSIAALGLALTSGLGGVALADDTTAAERIVVTGSRIVRRDFEANSPIVTIEADTFEAQTNVGIEAYLNKLPQVVPGLAQFSTGDVQPSPTNNPGSATVNLRGLGTNRTLVLIDGRRAQPGNASLVVDLNTVPGAALENVEVITGGASAVYGADAVAGVVNLRLRRDYEGFEVSGQWGQAEEGDGQEWQVSTLLGGNFDSGRGNALIGMNFAARDEVRNMDREFFKKAFFDTGTPNAGSSPFLPLPLYNVGSEPFQPVFAPFNAPTALAFQNIFGAPPPPGPFPVIGVNEDGTVFRPTGSAASPAPRYNGEAGGPQLKVQDNGNLGAANVDSRLSSPFERWSVFANGHIDITENITAFGQASASQSWVESLLLYAPAVQFWGAAIPHGPGIYAPSVIAFGPNAGDTNPDYLAGGKHGLNCGPVGGCTNSEAFPTPPELAALLDSRPTAGAPWALDTETDFLGPRMQENTTTTYQLLTGFEGTLPVRDWTWELYGTHGRTEQVSDFVSGFASTQKYRAVVQSANYGQGFAFSATEGRAATCTSGIPIFGEFEMSQDCIDAIQAPMTSTSELIQDVVEFNTQGGILDLPAGELRGAIGVAYRSNEFEFKPDPLLDVESIADGPSGIFAQNNTGGTIDASEIYGELLVPLLADLPLVQSLELELGYRYSDYSTAGGVDTYKILGDWAVNEHFRVRGGFQHATRAPNIAELFQSPAFAVVGAPMGDPCAVTTPVTWGNIAANPNRAQTQALCAELIAKFDPNFDYTGQANTYLGIFPFYFPLAIDIQQGNPDLGVEVGETWTAGFVASSPIDHPLLSGITMSVDWYNIAIEDAIFPLTSQVLYEQCFNADGVSNPALTIAGNPFFCGLINREVGTGGGRNANAPFANVGSLETTGIDLQVNWRADTADLGMPGDGSLSVNVAASFLDEYLVQASPGGTVVDYAGTMSQGGQYDYKLFTTFGYNQGPAGVSLRWRHLPETESAAFATNQQTTMLPTKKYDVFDLSGRYQFNDTYEFRAGVDNVLDTDPPRVGRNPGNSNASGATSVTNYDILGRRYYVGVTARF
jgi:outer membrane receptor protein involved in Fe transport